MLSTLLGWSLDLTCLAIGAVVILYTVAGGTRAVSQTQKQQMVVMLGGMVVAFVVVVRRLPPELSFGHALSIAGAFGKMKVVDFSARLDTRYTFWSGMLGGGFVALAYFGTDQSQVQRYLSGRSLTESRLGLLFNGLFKVPMQFLILLVGVMVFVFYQFHPPPLFFNEAELARVARTPHAAELQRPAGRATGRAPTRDAPRSSAWPARCGREDPTAIAAARQGVQRGRRPHRRRPGADARADPRRRSRAPNQRRRLRLPVVRAGELSARRGRAAAGGDPVRRHVVDGQRAHRAGRLHDRRLLPAQRPARRLRRPLRARGHAWRPARGACWRWSSRRSRRCSTT